MWINDTITGTTEPDAWVHVCANIPNNCINRWVQASSTGEWTANFHIAGEQDDDKATVDLLPGSNGWASQYDVEPNQTWVDWSVPNPHLDVWFAEDAVDAYDFPAATLLILTVADIDGHPVFDTTGTTDTNSGNPLVGYLHFDLNGQHDIQAGETITVSGGGFTKVLFVKHLTLTSVNAETDQMTGTAEPGSNMWICAWLGDHCNIRGITASGAGSWTADYSTAADSDNPVLDLLPRIGGGINISDEDGDNTSLGWNILDPRIVAFPNSNQVGGDDWPLDTLISLTVEDPATPKSPDWQGSDYSQPAPWNANATWMVFISIPIPSKLATF